MRKQSWHRAIAFLLGVYAFFIIGVGLWLIAACGSGCAPYLVVGTVILVILLVGPYFFLIAWMMRKRPTTSKP